MHNYSIKIILKIWAAALLMNTLLGTAILTDLFTDASMIGLFMLVGFVYAAVFTLPLIILLFIFLRVFVRMELSGKKLFGAFFATGLLLTMACFTLFFVLVGTLGFPIWSLLFVAMGSAAVGMLLEYRPVLQLRKEEEETHFQNFLE